MTIYNSENPEDTVVKEQQHMKPPVPDFEPVKQYLKDNPTAIKNIAPELVDQINEAIDTAPVGLSGIIRSYIYGKSPVVKDILEGTNNSNGSNGNSHREVITPELCDPEGDRQGVSPREWEEVLERMAELDSKGIAPREISDFIYDEYNCDLSPVKVKSVLTRYYDRVPTSHAEARGDEIDEEVENRKDSVIKTLVAKNKALSKEVGMTRMEKAIDCKVKEKLAELLPEPIAQEKTEILKKKGLIRRFLAWAI